ncbi:MarR family transcriptional regulator [Kribbella antibiotica]|uniref:MarR family transcriptional regulator n=1 Tax=Kribbella antibiotica TaxID=190195 RepID=A0A4R4YFH2_9ACTN|nr:MarR family winged helix-turn-helix transcriptional regulator [Kribbella antibiotica]TDD43528.1 MarR family transcriptional regulator [Kribbella antibiotica]
MSSAELPRLGRKPFIALVDRANRALQIDMVREMHARGYPKVKQAHNAVFATLQEGGSRSADMAMRAGMTRQSMGELIREMVALGILEMRPDPEDGRAKLVTYTDQGLAVASDGYRRLLGLEEHFAEEFGPDEYATARDVLARVADVLERWSDE